MATTPGHARTATALACVAVACGALSATGAAPAAAWRLLAAPGGGDPTSALVGALGLTAWAVAAWLLLAAAATAGGHLPGRIGRAAAGTSRRIAPAAVRRAVELALGLTVTTAALGAGPAAASGPSLDWGGPVASAVPDLDWGASPVRADPADALPAESLPAAVSPAAVVVAPGDSLWVLAERDLAERSEAPPSDAAVAQAWPAWWAANREAVGPDPHLLHPGTSLTPPARA